MNNYKLQMIRGDTFSFDLELTDVEISSINNIAFTVKRKLFDEQPVIRKEFNDGIESVGENIFRVRVAPEDTADFEIGFYVFDIEVSIEQDVYTVLRGTLYIAPDVTENRGAAQ